MENQGSPHLQEFHKTIRMIFLHTNTFVLETYACISYIQSSIYIYIYGNDGMLTFQTQVEVLFYALVTSFAYDTTFHILLYFKLCTPLSFIFYMYILKVSRDFLKVSFFFSSFLLKEILYLYKFYIIIVNFFACKTMHSQVLITLINNFWLVNESSIRFDIGTSLAQREACTNLLTPRLTIVLISVLVCKGERERINK